MENWECVGLVARVVLPRVDSLGREILVGALLSADLLPGRSGDIDLPESQVEIPDFAENGLVFEGDGLVSTIGLLGLMGRTGRGGKED